MSTHALSPFRAFPVLVALIFNVVIGPLAPIAATPVAALSGSNFNVTDANLVDGDGAGAAERDWCSTGTGALAVTRKDDLPSGSGDNSYKAAKENELNPEVENGSIPNNKVDLNRMYVASETVNSQLLMYVAWVRNDTSGTGTIDFELNQSDVVLSNGINHQRTAGDLLFEFDFHANPGSGNGYAFTLTYRTWSGTAWGDSVALGANAEGSINGLNTITDCLNGNETLGVATFGEFAVNLTSLLGNDCIGFASIFAKSRSSNQITSELKEVMAPTPVNFNTCGDITILKNGDNNDALGGATFTITPNPFTKTGSLDVTDNSAPDDNAAAGVVHIEGVEPGSYTVCEKTAPAGYIKQTACVGPLAIGANGSATFGPFVNTRGAVSWTKTDAVGGAKLCCATFTLEGISGPGDPVSITVVDNGLNDEDADAGELSVSHLPVNSTYRITETAAPAGYGLPSPAFQDVALVGASASAANSFADPHKLASIKVEKHDTTVNGALIDTAKFQLWNDVNANGTLEPLTDTKIGAEVSTSGGIYTWTALDFGKYLVQETVAPTGYDLPATTVQAVTINAATNGGTVTVQFADPRKTSSLKVEKRDTDANGALLDGAKFKLWLDDGDGTFDAGDTLVAPGEIAAAGGTYTWTGLGFGKFFVQETVAPTGYDLPAASVQGPFTIDATNAGGLTFTVVFGDPHAKSELTVKKIDAQDHSIVLSGAHFDLYLEAGATDTLIDSCITGADGTCTIGDLDFGTYYWVETAAPTGYDLPADTMSDPITIDADSAGTQLTVTVFSDPRQPGMIMVDKVDAADGSPLAGAVFELRSGTADGALIATWTSNAAGHATFADVAFGTYFVVETTPPAGFELPEETSCGPIVIGALHLSDVTTCAGDNAFTDAEKPAGLSLDKQVAEEGSSTFVGVGLKADTATDLFVDYGNSVVYRYLVTNTGEQTIDGLTITDDQVASGDITCDETTLAPSESTTCTSSPQTVTGKVTNDAVASGTFTTAGGTTNVESNHDKVTVDVRSLAVVKTNSAEGPVAPGTAVDFTLTFDVTNGPIASVVIVDQLPTGIDSATTISDGGTYDPTANAITWHLSDVADGDTLTYTATVNSTATAGSYVNVATITEGPCVGSDCTDDSTVVVRVPTLVIDKAANVDLITISGPANAQIASPSSVTWTLTFTLASGPVTHAVITDPVPTGFTFVSASNGGVYDATTRTITWSLGTLTASGSVTFVTAVNVATISRNGPTVNVATIVSDQTAPDTGQDSVGVTVIPPPLAGNPTPTPKVPNTAVAFGPGGQPMTVPIELLVVLFLGSFGGLVFANVRAVQRRRR